MQDNNGNTNNPQPQWKGETNTMPIKKAFDFETILNHPVKNPLLDSYKDVISFTEESYMKKKTKTIKKEPQKMRMTALGTMETIEGNEWVNIKPMMAKSLENPYASVPEVWVTKPQLEKIKSPTAIDTGIQFYYDVFLEKIFHINTSINHKIVDKEGKCIGVTTCRYGIGETNARAPSNNESIPKNIRISRASYVLFDEKLAVEAYCTDIPCYVAYHEKDDLVKCDYSGKMLIGFCWCNVSGSNKYKVVEKTYVNAASPAAPFFRCTECGHIFEKKNNQSEFNPSICVSCYAKIEEQASIAPYNDKHIPKPIYQQKSRLGHKIAPNGLIFATMKHQLLGPESHVLWGVELETELNKPVVVNNKLNRFSLAKKVKELLGSDFVNVKEDGSLVKNGKYNGDSSYDPDGSKNGKMFAGFEIVSCPASMEVHEERWQVLDSAEIKSPDGRPYFVAWDTETCGMHVHRSKADLTVLHVGRILHFINHKKNQQFVFKVAGRSSAKFCRYIPKEVVDGAHPERVISPEEASEYDKGRRVAVNVKPKHTIEFRIFRGTMNYRHVMRNMQFCDAVVCFCAPAERSIADLGEYKKFVNYVDCNRKRWPLLAEWFAVQDIIKLKKISAKANKSKLTLKPELVTE